MNKLTDKIALVTGTGLPVEGDFNAVHIHGVSFE